MTMPCHIVEDSRMMAVVFLSIAGMHCRINCSHGFVFFKDIKGCLSCRLTVDHVILEREIDVVRKMLHTIPAPCNLHSS